VKSASLIIDRECSIKRHAPLTPEIIRAKKKKNETETGNSMFKHADSIKNSESLIRRRNP